MRHILILLLCFQVVLIMSGCCPCSFDKGSDKDKESAPSETTETAE